MESFHSIVRRLRTLPPWAPDAALAVLLAAVEVSYLFILGPEDVLHFPNYREPSVLSVGVALSATLPLVARRRAPLTVMTIVGVASFFAVPLGIPLAGFGLVFGLYTVAAYSERRDSLILLGVFVVVTLVAMVLADSLRFVGMNAVIFLTAWILGDRMKARRQYTAGLEQRAQQLEREREDKAALAVAGERQRIARELHDVVAHSVSVMVVQTSAARRVLERHPDRAAEALDQVEATGRQSLVELRRILGVLRTDAAPSMSPQPRLEFLGELVDQFRGVGLPVELAVEGTPASLAPGLDLSAYRIVQEALTNVLKHAGDARVQVRLSYGEGMVAVEVVDDGNGPRPGTSDNGSWGHGLVGMKERVTLLGGELQAGARAGGGFRVHATLPLEES